MSTLFDPKQPAEIELRPYQVDAVQQLRDGIRAGKRRQVLVSPTGSGKTEMALNIIKASQAKGSTTWFIVDRINLIDQTSERFAKYGIDHGIIQAKNIYTDLKKPVQVASAQTLARRKIDWLPDLIVVDEAHTVYKATIDLIARAAKAKVIGLTATPFTKGMAEDWDALVNSVTVNQLLKLGFLSPLKVKACVAPDMTGAKKNISGEWDEEEAGLRGSVIIGDVVQTWIDQTELHFKGPVKTLVFSPSVKHGAELCRQFGAAGYNFQQISYLDADDESRREKIAEFRKPDSAIHGLVSCAVLTKGFDVPDVQCGISCRPYRKSFSSHIQEMGRTMRISPDKEFALWLCHSGNCVAFAQDTSWLFEYGAGELSDAAKKDSTVREPEEKTRKEQFCRECGMQMPPATFVCVGCGWERPNRGDLEVVEGVLVDLDFKAPARDGLRAECLQDPRGMWNAALAYCSTFSRHGDASARKWAFGIWKGLYPTGRLPRGYYDMPHKRDTVKSAEWAMVEREVRNYRKRKSYRAQKSAA